MIRVVHLADSVWTLMPRRPIEDNESAAADDRAETMDDETPTILLRSIDRWRREIVVTRERWVGHVLAQHPELADGLEAIGLALTDSDFVRRDTRHHNRRPPTVPGRCRHQLTICT